MKKLMLILFSVVMGLISLQSVYADGYSTNQIETYTVVPNKNADIINLKIQAQDDYVYSGDYKGILNEFRTRAYLSDGKYRNPENPNEKLYRNQNSLLKTSSRLGYISRIRAIERSMANSEYRLNGQRFSSLKIDNINSECEIFAPRTVHHDEEGDGYFDTYNSEELYNLLKTDEQNWLNGKDASRLYKAIISPKYKSYSETDGLFEFSTKLDTNGTYDDAMKLYTIPTKANNIKIKIKTATYLEVGGRNYELSFDFFYRDKKIDSSNYYLLNSNFNIISDNNSVVKTITPFNKFHFYRIAGVSVGYSNITLQIDGKNVLTYSVGVDKNPYRNSWQKVGNNLYYYDGTGLMQTNKWIGDYYVKSNGVMASNEWIGKYYVDGTGKWVPNKAKATEGWHKTKEGAYWYQNSDGSYPKKQWKEISKRWYHFNEKGYRDHNKWIGDYYVKASGEMATNEWIGKYYVDGTGKWVPNKTKVTEGWHKTKEGAYWYQNADGSYPKKQWKEISKRWYHFNENGYMDHNKWIGDYYVKASGEMATNEWIGKYYVDSTGKWVPNKTKVTEGWHKTKEGAYWYQNSDGSYPKKQWQKINTHWYHFNDKGYMDHDKWIGYYYVKSSGEMATNEWIDKFYVDGTGKWDPKKVDTSYGWRKTKEGAFWYQEKNGSFPKNQWKQIDGQWYHFNESGYMDHDKWVGYYYVKSNGVMAKNERIGIFYVGSDGLWQPGV